MLTLTQSNRFIHSVVFLTFFIFWTALSMQPAKSQQKEIELGSVNSSRKMNIPTQIKEIRLNLNQASQSIANHDYFGTKSYLDKAISLFQGVQQAGKAGGSGMQASLNKIESEIFITHQQMIIGQRKREEDRKSVFRKTQVKQVDSMAHYYDLWDRDVKSWQPD